GPVEIAHLEAESPRVELIHDPAGGFRGWNLLGDDSPESSASRSDLQNPAPEGLPNQYVRIHQGELRNGRFVYGPPDSEPMTLHNIHISLQPGPDDRPEWQPVTASGRSEGLLHTSLTGRFNLGALVLDLDRFQL